MDIREEQATRRFRWFDAISIGFSAFWMSIDLQERYTIYLFRWFLSLFFAFFYQIRIPAIVCSFNVGQTLELING